MAPIADRRAEPVTGSRIQRPSADPVFGHGLKRTPSEIEIEHRAETLQLRYYLSRWHLTDPDLPCVRQRVIQAKLYVGNAHAGSFEFNELRPIPLIDNREFFEWADAVSGTLSELAEVLCSHWEAICEVSDYGTILELSRAWMNPVYSSGRRFELAAKALIGLSKDWALLVLKAFPLEYEGLAGQHVEAQSRRQRAMIRHYQSCFGVVPFPGTGGDEGWMYMLREGKPIAHPIPGAGNPYDGW